MKERGKITDKDRGQIVRRCIDYPIDKYRTAKCVLVRKDVRVVSIEEIDEEKLYIGHNYEGLESDGIHWDWNEAIAGAIGGTALCAWGRLGGR